MIYIYGDSHVSSFVINNNIDYIINTNTFIKKDKFIAYRFEPYTCFNLINKSKYILDILQKNNKKDDIIFFNFGEVDIRCHIGFYEENNNINILIDNCIDRYISFLLYIKQYFNNINVFGPIASGINNSMQGNGRPSYKTSYERNQITELFTNVLRKKCNDNNINFKSIFNNLQKDYNTIEEYYVDKIHLGFSAQKLLEKEFEDLDKIYD